MINPALLANLSTKYPFINLIRHGDNDYIGLIQNQDPWVTNFYDFSAIKNTDQRKLFLDLAEQWWWESSRKVPINLFLKAEWQIFKPYLKIFVTKEVQVLHGPITSLSENLIRKIKRRSITLVRKI